MATTTLLLLLLLLLLLSLSHLSYCISPSSPSPFTAKAALLRYWNRKVPNKNPQPSFFTSKLSPLSPLDLSTFSSLTPSQLSSRLPSFCSSAGLLCSPLLFNSSLSSHNSPSNFTSYSNSNFTNYATKGHGFNNSFSSYSPSENVPVDTFRRYSRDAVFDADSFTAYSTDGNVVTTNFTSYSAAAVGGSGDFSLYHPNANIPDLSFTSYDSSATGPRRDFTSYTQSANVGNATFTSYAKSSNAVPTTFTSYSDNFSNIITSQFSGYGESANGAVDNFTSYGKSSNIPDLEFKSYGDGGTGPVDNFALYRNTSGDGDDTFVSYGKNANGEKAGFENYGYIPPSTGGFGYGTGTNKGKDSFKGYGEESFDDVFNFTNYLGHFNEFSGYVNDKPNQNVFSFKSYVNATNVPHADNSQLAELMKKMKESKPASTWVDPGKFFRESELKKGTVMPMPDIRDKFPPRSFLPRAIASKIPFSAGEVNEIFKIPADTAMGKAVVSTTGDCERAPSRGETKRCATSAEDMIDFAVSVLGSNVVVRSTENTNGSRGKIMIGDVKGINGGKVTESVSCHQSLFPYLVYYCHSVPKVRVYEADILTVDAKQKINHGVAICHLDTSDWSAGHAAFIALGSAPGQIEVCHWIFEGDMTWAVAD